MDRTLYRWTAKIQSANDGETKPVSFSCYWDPTKDFITPESIAVAAAARETVKTKIKHVGISASLIHAAA